MAKRTLDTFFSPVQKKAKLSITESKDAPSTHHSYPFAVPQLPPEILEALNFCPASEGKAINDQADLDLLYFQPYIPASVSTPLFDFLRQELFFYRVKYTIQRGSVETEINTPRFTTVFGVDATSFFSPSGDLLDSATQKPIEKGRYRCHPRPIPQCLDTLRKLTEGATDQEYNFCLVNYYASGEDSISYHSDDEKFLGQEPAIASFSLGAKRDFCMKHKPLPPSSTSSPSSIPTAEPKPLKLPLGSGDMVLMRGSTQSKWLHSIPKRKGGDAEKGRINITFRKAMVKGGTENYYRYNVGQGEVWKWDERGKKMVVWEEEGKVREKGQGVGEVKLEDVDRGYAGL